MFKLNMLNHLIFAQRFLLFVSPILTGASVTFALGISASPSLAATLASSEAIVQIDNFSHNPQGFMTSTDTNTFAFTSDGSVVALADANAIAKFAPSDFPKLIFDYSLSKTSGEGSSYYGQAQSLGGVVAYNFFVGDGKPFDFDFDAFLGLNASTDHPQSEIASAAGQLSFKLNDSTDINNLTLLNSFTIFGNLITPGQGDSLEFQISQNITLNSDFKNADIDATEKSVYALVQGHFSRYFANPISLTLIEGQSNQAIIKVPEPSNTLALFFFGLILFWLQFKTNSSNN